MADPSAGHEEILKAIEDLSRNLLDKNEGSMDTFLQEVKVELRKNRNTNKDVLALLEHIKIIFSELPDLVAKSILSEDRYVKRLQEIQRARAKLEEEALREEEERRREEEEEREAERRRREYNQEEKRKRHEREKKQQEIEKEKAAEEEREKEEERKRLAREAQRTRRNNTYIQSYQLDANDRENINLFLATIVTPIQDILTNHGHQDPSIIQEFIEDRLKTQLNS